MRRVSQRDLLGMLGPDAAKAILAIEDQQWHGPIESTRGVHFAKVLEKIPARTVSYEEAQPYIKDQFILSKAREVLELKTTELRKDYEIVIESAIDGSKL
jgi:peptidyl-prolyl cis-trans isomerase C